MTDLLNILCEECWDKRNPKRKPHLSPEDTHSPCSDCGKETNSGIYVATTKTPEFAE